jgi:hypothetical protein
MRKRGALPRRAVWADDIGTALRHADSSLVTAIAVGVHLPFVIGLLGDAPPGWLDTAWQVSATLVGLGVAVVVFLLQAAGSQSLSSDVTYSLALGLHVADLASRDGARVLGWCCGDRALW